MNLLFAGLLIVVGLLQIPQIRRKDKRWKLGVVIMIASFIMAIVSIAIL